MAFPGRALSGADGIVLVGENEIINISAAVIRLLLFAHDSDTSFYTHKPVYAAGGKKEADS